MMAAINPAPMRPPQVARTLTGEGRTSDGRQSSPAIPSAAAELRRLHAELVESDAIAAIKEERDALQSENAELWADAERYWWLAKHGRSTSEHWGGRWSIVIDGPCPKSHNSEDDFDAAIDAARSKTWPKKT